MTTPPITGETMERPDGTKMVWNGTAWITQFDPELAFFDYDNTELFNQLAALLQINGYIIEDSSWSNDACPSMLWEDLHDKDKQIKIYVDYAKPAMREIEDAAMIAVISDLAGVQCNTVAEAVKAFEDQYTGITGKTPHRAENYYQKALELLRETVQHWEGEEDSVQQEHAEHIADLNSFLKEIEQ